jgi:hypothetical protein
MATTTETQVDVQVTGEGTIFLFDLRTEKAREWVAENVGGETNYFAGSLAVEHRYARDLANGMIGDGLVVR